MVGFIAKAILRTGALFKARWVLLACLLGCMACYHAWPAWWGLPGLALGLVWLGGLWSGLTGLAPGLGWQGLLSHWRPCSRQGAEALHPEAFFLQIQQFCFKGPARPASGKKLPSCDANSCTLQCGH